jgi:hypothetical protein
MYQPTQQFYNIQINTTEITIGLLHGSTYCYMFRPCRVIIRQSLQEYVIRYWIIYLYGSRSVIYKFSCFVILTVKFILKISCKKEIKIKFQVT